MEKVFIRIVGEGRCINQTQRLLDGVAVWVSRTTSESSGAPDSLVDSCTGEGGDEDLDTDATNAMGRSVAQALQDDQEEDLELARDLAAVGFDEPRDCCGILTRFGHASLARYSCAMCCGTYVYWCMGLFIQGIIPWLFCCWFCELWCVSVHKSTHGRIIARFGLREASIRAQVRLRRLALDLLLLYEKSRRKEDVVGVALLAALLRHHAVPDHGHSRYAHLIALPPPRRPPPPA